MYWFLLLFLSLFSLVATEYDCIFVGTSPISLFEALYQNATGKSVLILEEAGCCGGAWQSVDICGVAHADVGCHEIGSSPQLKDFLQEYAGCSLIQVDSGFYFDKGCYELIHNLECCIQNSAILLLKNHKVDRVHFNLINQRAVVESGGELFTCQKIFAPSYAYFPIDDEAFIEPHKTKFPHLYLLIYDPTPPRFAYRHGVSQSSRMMNLTHFVDLDHTGRQLIVLQTRDTTYSESYFLEELKAQKLVDSSAYLLDADWFIYEQYPANRFKQRNNPCFEPLQTCDFRGMQNHIPRWKMALTPYSKPTLTSKDL